MDLVTNKFTFNKKEQVDVVEMCKSLQMDGVLRKWRARGGSLTTTATGPYSAYVGRKLLHPWFSEPRRAEHGRFPEPLPGRPVQEGQSAHVQEP